jgi:hypothetical protein
MTAGFLIQERDSILAAATVAATRTPHYAAVGHDETAQRLDALLEELVGAVRDDDLGPIVMYGRELARLRCRRGYELGEVQVAMNALEEAIWQRSFASLPAEAAGDCVRLVSTALGAAKDALAREYVQLAAVRVAPTVDVEALMRGTTAG